MQILAHLLPIKGLDNAESESRRFQVVSRTSEGLPHPMIRLPIACNCFDDRSAAFPPLMHWWTEGFIGAPFPVVGSSLTPWTAGCRKPPVEEPYSSYTTQPMLHRLGYDDSRSFCLNRSWLTLFVD